MKELVADLWECPGTKVITTNGTLKGNGTCVMGRGVALQAVRKYPGVEYALGGMIKELGNHVFRLRPGLYSFPVKTNWWDAADLGLIAQSRDELLLLAGGEKLYIPRPGCGAGGLSWEVVRPLMLTCPDDVTVVSPPWER